MHTTLYVGSLASHEDEHELVRLFSTYGTVVYAKVVIDPDFFRRYGGFAVVEMETTEETANAMHLAREMRIQERRQRHESLIKRLRARDVGRWRRDFIAALADTPVRRGARKAR